MLRSVMVSLLCGLLATACGGGTFQPSSGAFLGKFSDATLVELGDLSFTAHTQGVAGTGILHDGALDINVAISGNVNGSQISGTVSNSFLGSGSFKGAFTSANSASGTFTFTETETNGKLTGTWTASVQ